MHPHGYICQSEGVHLGLAIEEKYIFTYYLFPNIYAYISEIFFKNPHMLIVKYVYEYNHNKISCHKKF